MAIEKFKWSVQNQHKGQVAYKYRVRTAQFGDGYTQRVTDGINAETISYPLTWGGRTETVKEVRDFLKRGVSKAFLFTPPGESEGLYRVDPDSLTYTAESVHVATVSANLTQAYSA